MIHYHPTKNLPEKPTFSILIPTWNNLDFVRLCVESIRKNSAYEHQIVLHINDGSEGTLAWAKAENLDFTHSDDNVGICLACNAAYSLAKAEYILYMNDDMYACPNWDVPLLKAIQEYGKDDFYFSATMIEREDARCEFVSSPHNFGSTVQNFQEEELQKNLSNLTILDWQGANFPPSVMHRRYWDLIGGFSIEFSPGMYSDPDICRKLWTVGVRNFRGIGDSLVYHFMSKSIGRVKKNDGKRQFLLKWGITPRTFFDFYLHQPAREGDARYKGILPEPEETMALKWQRWLGGVKRRFR